MQVVAPKVPNTGRRPTFRSIARAPIVPKIRKEQNLNLNSSINHRNFEVFDHPITPQEAKEKYYHLLTNADLADINNFPEIYYIRSNLPPCKNTARFSRYKPDKNKSSIHYPFTEREHIAFRYEQMQLLGRGTFGIVIKCLDHKEKDFVAMKIVKNLPQDLEQIQMENEFLRLFQENGKSYDSHIIRLLNSFQYRGYTCFVTELMAIDLYKFQVQRYPQGIPKNIVKIMIRQIACSIKAVHRHGYVHCDIKPENIMLLTHSSMKPSLRLIDFGCICQNRKPKFQVVQSLYYRAPEVLYGFRYGAEIDVWSFGALIFEMLTGRPLFPAKDEKELRDMHVNLLGLPPVELVRKSRMMPKFFKVADCENVNRQDQKERARIRLQNQLGEENKEFTDLILDCLEWHPLLRITINQVTNYHCLF